MDRQILQVYNQKDEEVLLVQTSEEPSLSRKKSLVMCFTIDSLMPLGGHAVVIQTSSSFSYKNDKKEPWKYGINLLKGKHNEKHKDKFLGTNNIVVNNISGIRGMTRSGRLFIPTKLRKDISMES